jgi:hypothetical protein
MNDVVTRYAEAAFVLLVTGCALIWPPLALIAGAGYLIALAVLADRRIPAAEPKT